MGSWPLRGTIGSTPLEETTGCAPARAVTGPPEEQARTGSSGKGERAVLALVDTESPLCAAERQEGSITLDGFGAWILHSRWPLGGYSTALELTPSTCAISRVKSPVATNPIMRASAGESTGNWPTSRETGKPLVAERTNRSSLPATVCFTSMHSSVAERNPPG